MSQISTLRIRTRFISFVGENIEDETRKVDEWLVANQPRVTVANITPLRTCTCIEYREPYQPAPTQESAVQADPAVPVEPPSPLF